MFTTENLHPLCGKGVQSYQNHQHFSRKSAVDDTIDCGLFNFLYEKALKLRELRDTGVQIASGVPLFSFWGPGDRYGEGKNLNPSPVSLEGKLKDWRKIKMWPPVLPKETGGHAHVFFSRFFER